MENKQYGRTKIEYVNAVESGQLIAFTNEDRMLSAKVIQVVRNTDTHDVVKVKVRTLNGSIYYVKAEKIVWIKSGTRWPTGVFNALKNQSNKIVNTGEDNNKEIK